MSGGKELQAAHPLAISLALNHVTRARTVGRNNPEAYAAAALAVREFRRRYRAALAAWRKDRSATFPPGTFVMRWLHNANVAAG